MSQLKCIINYQQIKPPHTFDRPVEPVGSELFGSRSAPGLENFADRTRSKKILVQIIIFFEFFLIIDNVKAIKHKTNDIKCVNLFI